MSAAAEREKLKYHRRKEQGMCVRCGKEKAKESRTMCPACLEERRIYQQSGKDLCKRFGLCYVCKTNKVYGKERMCPECRAKAYEKREQSKIRLGVTSSDYTKNRYARLKAQGLCQHCGRNPVENGRFHCDECLEKKRTYSAVKRMIAKSKRKLDRSERPSYGLCYRCGKPLDRDGKMCMQCYSTNHFITGEERGKPKSWLKENDLLFRKRGNKHE